MTDPRPLAPELAAAKLKTASRWVVERGRIYRDARFESFAGALETLNAIARLAEDRGHHPNLLLHEWCFLRVELYTHLVGGISDLDVALALEIEPILRARESERG